MSRYAPFTPEQQHLVSEYKRLQALCIDYADDPKITKKEYIKARDAYDEATIALKEANFLGEL